MFVQFEHGPSQAACEPAEATIRVAGERLGRFGMSTVSFFQPRGLARAISCCAHRVVGRRQNHVAILTVRFSPAACLPAVRIRNRHPAG